MPSGGRASPALSSHSGTTGQYQHRRTVAVLRWHGCDVRVDFGDVVIFPVVVASFPLFPARMDRSCTVFFKSLNTKCSRLTSVIVIRVVVQIQLRMPSTLD